MARPIWTGSLAFGLVNVPVGLHAATEDHTVHFHQFQAGTADRIRYKRINERTGEEVAQSEIVRGHELGDGDFVLVTDEELAAVAPGRSQTIDITDFVDLADIDPVFFARAYYLVPQADGAGRAYRLLYRAMAETGKAAIATLVMHGKQHLAAIRATRGALTLETMYFADEVREPPEEIGDLPGAGDFRGRELALAKQLIESMTTGWDPEAYTDTYRERVEELIERKRRGEEIVAEEAPAAASNVVDLTEVLRRSMERARRAGPGGRVPGRARGGGGARTGAAAGARRSGQGSRRPG
jgi:DNA end-binding protein Ku